MNGSSYLLDPRVGWVLLLLFGAVWVALGLYWGRRARSLDGYMLAGRNVGLALGTATAVATWVTSNTTMLAPQFALQMGVWGMLAYSTASIGLFLFAPVAERIRQVMPRGYTSAEFFRLRYGPTAHRLFLVISLFYGLTWLISMAMAGGILLEALSGIPYAQGMTVVLTVCVLYTLFGGLYAVIGTDFIQSVIILIGIVAVGIAVLSREPAADIHARLELARPALLNALFPAALMSVFNNLLFGVGEVFHSNVWWSRAFAMRRGVGRRAYALAGLIWLPLPVAAGFMGLAAPALGVHVSRPDMVGPLVAGLVLGEIGAVVVFILVISSLASSIDSLLAATSDLVLKEIVQPVFLPHASEARLRKLSGYVVVGLGIFAWAVCLPKVGTLATVLFFAGPLVGSTIWPVVAGLYWRETNPAGASWAMVLGSGGGLIAYFTLGWYTGALVGTAVSLLVVVASTRLFPRPFAWARLAGEKV